MDYLLKAIRMSRNTVTGVFHWEFLIIYIFSMSLKFQWGEFTVKNITFCLHILSWYFVVVVFHQQNMFLSFSFLFLMKHRISATEYYDMIIKLLLLWDYIWYAHLQLHETTLEKITTNQSFHTILVFKLRSYILISWKPRP